MAHHFVVLQSGNFDGFFSLPFDPAVADNHLSRPEVYRAGAAGYA